MKQLTGLDATFLYMEKAYQFGHVSSLSIYERPDDPTYEPLEAWRLQIERRLHLLEPMRRRLRMVPFGLDHPFWIEDPDFDLDFHVRHTAIPRPGSDAQLQDVVARIIGRPLDRDRPLWETYVIEGLQGNRFGILTKFHHATIDGAAGAELLTMMVDTSPEGDPVPPPTEEWKPERVPSDGEMLAAAALTLARKPARGVVLTARTVREIGRATSNPILVAAANQLRSTVKGPVGALLNLGRERSDEPLPGPLPAAAPKTPFNAPITAHRRFAFDSVSLTLIKDIKNAVGATLNDVVMAAVAGGLRTYLLHHDALPEQALVAMVPVSIRTGDEPEKWTNRVSSIFAELPTNEPDAGERIRKVHEAMVNAKGLHDAVPADALTQFAQFPPPAVFTQAMRLATRLASSDRSPGTNLVISNVPGPRETLYAAGAKLVNYYPVSTITDGQGVNVTVQSYLDTLDFGVVSCRELVPDLDFFLKAIIDEVYALAKLAGVEPKAIDLTDAKPATNGTKPKAPAKARAKKATT